MSVCNSVCRNPYLQTKLQARIIKDSETRLYNNERVLTIILQVLLAKIVSVLTSMDNELFALEAKRKKYEQIKQGMMQQLLTGKIRLSN